MAYSDGEALLLTVVQAMTGFDSTNTSRGNWLVLNKGKSDHYAILRPGPFRLDWSTISNHLIQWETVVEVWQRYVDDATTKTNLYARVADILPIMSYPNMGDSSVVEDSTFEGGEEPQEMWGRSGGPEWLKWEMRIKWYERTAVTFAE